MQKSYVIVDRQTLIVQEIEEGLIRIFSSKEDAEKYLKLANRPESEIFIVECEVKRWNKANLDKPDHHGMKADTVIIDDVY